MKKTKIILVFTILLITKAYAQPMHKAWDYRYGGTNQEWSNYILATADKGYLIGGTTESGLSGDITEVSRGFVDMYVVKLDSLGVKQWDRRYGGTGYEAIISIVGTNDNGYILAGYSFSDISGDKTTARRGGMDYWLVKIDSLGNKLWDNTYGGSKDDYMYSNAIISSDNGIVFGGDSESGISGDKSEPNRDPTNFYRDYWVVKTDSAGNKLWDKTYGGTGDDVMTTLIETTDGGYLLGGRSKSDISGDKTAAKIGGFDWWVVKVDSMGNKEWDRVYGTVNEDRLYSMCKTNDGNYILAGGGFIIRIIDDYGMTLLEKNYVGCATINYITTTSDNGYLLSGEARSICVGGPIYPDKTEANLGRYQTWFVKTDSAFNKQWDKTVFSPNEDYYGVAIETPDNCYVAASSSKSWVGGYKSQPNWDTTNNTTDFWIVKLCEDPSLTPTFSQVEGVSVVVYPNPFVNEVIIALQQEQVQEATYVLTTIDGKILYQQQEAHLAAGYTKIWDLSPLPSGVYIITVNIKGENITKRVVKE